MAVLKMKLILKLFKHKTYLHRPMYRLEIHFYIFTVGDVQYLHKDSFRSWVPFASRLKRL